MDAACDVFEAAWRAGHAPRIEDHLAGAVEADRTALLRELLGLELELRRARGEWPGPSEYRARFPGHAGVVDDAFGAATAGGDGDQAGGGRGDAARNLLFGVLALQNNFVSRDDLVAAFGSWVADKSRPIGQVFRDRGALDAGRHALLEALVVEHLRLHGDDPERSLAALSSLGSARRDLEGVPDADVLASLASLGAGRAAHDPDDTAPYRPAAPASPGPRFRILRPHAKGGLGEVFVARDEELNREVALKRIQPQFADDPESQARFLVEAEVTGRLGHPGVVPVYGLGHYDDGRPFYAMRFVEGDSLKEAVRRFHEGDTPGRDPGARALALRELLGRFVDVCDAVGYAHSRGVLHRDIKPGNVMLGRFGETLVVDWGLAKSVGRREGPDRDTEPTLRPAGGGDSTATRYGSKLGTPAYMSPEQAAGDLDRLGPRSDVYSLGASLYTILTGRAPVSDPDPGVVLDAVRRGDFPPPRRVNPKVPAALEAVCLKAMALSPGDRYGSPGALAEDVNRWLADEPVSVYREGLVARSARWARRHKPLVSGLAALVVTALPALAVGALLIDRQRTRAERNLARARDVVEEMYGRVAERLEDQDGMEAYQEEILRKALRFYEEFALPQGNAPALRLEAGRAGLRAGQIRHKLGQAAGAESALRSALAVLEPLAAARPADPRPRALLADVEKGLGILYHTNGRSADAEAALTRAVDVRKRLVAAYPRTEKYRFDLASDLGAMGDALSDLGRNEESKSYHEQSLRLLEGLIGESPGNAGYRLALAMGLTDHAEVERLTGRTGEAENDFKRSIGLLETLVAGQPEATKARSILGQAEHNLALLLHESGRVAEARPPVLRAVEIREGLARGHPGIVKYRLNLARSYENLFAVELKQGRPAEAEAALGRALPLFEGLAASYPAVVQYQGDLVRALTNLAVRRIMGGRNAEAEALLLRASAAQERLVKAHPESFDLAIGLGRTYALLGAMESSKDQLDWLDRAARVLEPVHRHDVRNARARRELSGVYGNRAQLLEIRGRYEESLSDMDRALALDAGQFRLFFRARRAMLLARLKDHRGAEAEALALESEVSGGHVYDLACALALAAAAAGRDDSLPPAERARQADRAASRAVALLQRARREGHFRSPKSSASLATDADLDALRGRTDFRGLLGDVAFPTDPFAR